MKEMSVSAKYVNFLYTDIREHMRNLVITYIVIMSASAALFSGFISCGAQLYKVPLNNDVDSKLMSQEALDPNSPNYGIHAPKGWNVLPIKVKTADDLSLKQRNMILAAMSTWEWAVGKKLFVDAGIHEGVTGDSFTNLYISLSDKINGHYYDHKWSKTGKQEQVLATTIWQNLAADPNYIETSDIRYNADKYDIGDSLELIYDGEHEVVDLQSLALHELGHFLGLAHVSEQYDRYSIMNPSLFIGEGLTTREISRGDIERLQKIYGCDGNACDVDALMDEQEANRRSSYSSSTYGSEEGVNDQENSETQEVQMEVEVQ